MELHIGITGVDEVEVTQANTAETVGSGTLPVFATPAMLASMEKAAYASVQPYLDEGCVTFSVRSYAGGELIGKGIHKRCIISSERFLAKALSKLDNK